jgi:methionyl-tRNA synthetase
MSEETKTESIIRPELKEPEAAKEPIYASFDDFKKIELKVAQILSAERIEKSEKLVRLQVNVGETEPRQIIAGIAKHYTPEELVGKKIVIVANLKPAKLMGELSQGMLLAASDESGLCLIDPGVGISAGARVS